MTQDIKELDPMLDLGGQSQPEGKETVSIMPSIGEQMEDGTVFAGFSPDTGEGMFVMPEDEAGLYNVLQLDELTQVSMYQGYADWKVPSKNELGVLFNNASAIGGFTTNNADHNPYADDVSYLSSSWEQGLMFNSFHKTRFSDGRDDWGIDPEETRGRVRLIRYGCLPV